MRNPQKREISISKHLDEGIKCLDNAVKKGNKGDVDAGKKAVTDAITHFKQAAK